MIYTTSVRNKLFLFFRYILASIFFIGAAVNIKHPLLTLSWSIIGLITLPSGQKWIEQKIRFRLTNKIKFVFCIMFFFATALLARHYHLTDKKIAHELKVRQEKIAADELITKQNEQKRRDSFIFYFQSAISLEKSSKIDASLNAIADASKFSKSETERSEVEEARKRMLLVKVQALIKQRKYQVAIPELTNLLSSDPDNREILYDRAFCYSKIGKVQEAVTDLKPLVQSGEEKFNNLYEKINPIRKRIIGYETLCCDGSISYATGRGACSHHGGVCDWNHPIYEEYRKYN